MSALAVASETYSRSNPSPRYRELTALYAQMHVGGLPDQNIKAKDLFAGSSIIPQLPKIKLLVEKLGAKTLLDYGCGKGLQYRAQNIKLRSGEIIATVQGYLGVDAIACYDPGVTEFQTFPAAQFDGVISTDVLEHCPEPDLPWILGEMFGAARKFVFANIAAYPAAKTLPNGENAHCTVRPQEWWNEIIAPVAARHPGVFARFEVSKGYQA
jgi:2-polyprenyl-3-methyl-5-hydroxy-6-metoxy-1,4-benzoquinol methylase